MNAITSDWARTETDASVARAVGSGKAHRREEEFRSALANYVAGYIADQQRRRTAETVARSSYFTVVWRFAGWMRGWLDARTDLGPPSDRTGASPPKIPSEMNGGFGCAP